MTAAIVKRTLQLAYGAREIRRTASVRTVNSFLMALCLVGVLAILAMVSNRLAKTDQNFGVIDVDLPGVEVDYLGDQIEKFGGNEAEQSAVVDEADVQAQSSENQAKFDEARVIVPVDDRTIIDELAAETDELFFNDEEFGEVENKQERLGNVPFGGPSGPEAKRSLKGGKPEGTESKGLADIIYNDPNQFVDYDVQAKVDLSDLKSRVVFPHFASVRELEGTVVVRALIDVDGSIVRVLVFSADHDVFIENAVTAVKGVKATPALLDGRPIACWVSIPITFRLR